MNYLYHGATNLAANWCMHVNSLSLVRLAIMSKILICISFVEFLPYQLFHEDSL
uniref:Uncharacterized protein n=1 Tax=Rhizophora mucronata TaxID=61149 RepID=A0A2P2QHD4_RHIMU